MAHITTAGVSNWRAAFEGHPGLAVTPENYELLLAGASTDPAGLGADLQVPEPEPAPEPEPEVVPDPIPEPDSTPPESSSEPSEVPSEPEPEPELVRISDDEVQADG